MTEQAPSPLQTDIKRDMTDLEAGHHPDSKALITDDDFNPVWNYRHRFFARLRRCIFFHVHHEQTHDDYRTNFFEFDIKLHLLLTILAAIGTIWAVIAHAASALITRSAITVVYAAAYTLVYTRPVYTPGMSAVGFVTWWMALVVEWVAQIPLLVGDISTLTKPSTIFGWISFLLVLSVPAAYYHRFLTDSGYIMRWRQESATYAAPVHMAPRNLLLAKSGQNPLTLGDCNEWVITQVAWWQERYLGNHQYLIIRAVSTEPHTRPLFLRIERAKGTWALLYAATASQSISFSNTDVALTENSIPVAEYAIDLIIAQKLGFNLQLLGELIQILDTEAPSWIFPSFGVWWWTSCCFERLTQKLHPIDLNNLESRRYLSIWCHQTLPLTELYSLGRSIYLGEHWPYWSIICWLVYSIPNAFGSQGWPVVAGFGTCSSLFTFHYTCTTVKAWKRVRRKFQPNDSGPPTQSGYGWLLSAWFKMVSALFFHWPRVMPKV